MRIFKNNQITILHGFTSQLFPHWNIPWTSGVFVPLRCSYLIESAVHRKLPRWQLRMHFDVIFEQIYNVRVWIFTHLGWESVIGLYTEFIKTNRAPVIGKSEREVWTLIKLQHYTAAIINISKVGRLIIDIMSMFNMEWRYRSKDRRAIMHSDDGYYKIGLNTCGSVLWDIYFNDKSRKVK